MKQFGEEFKKEAVKLSDDIGVKNAAEKLGISYNTLNSWRKKYKEYGKEMHVGSGKKRTEISRESELEKEIKDLKRANDILYDALCFFVEDRKK